MDRGQINKIQRVLDIYTKLSRGALINKSATALEYGCNERSIQRDIDDIRDYIECQGVREGALNTVIYDRERRGYRLEKIESSKLTNPEILAICKILLDSRAFVKDELVDMLDRLIENSVPEENKKYIHEMIRNEEYHYIEPRHQSRFLDKMWDIGQAIREQRYIEIQYQGVLGTSVKTRKLKPLAIMFSEYYFYLTALIEDEKVRENFQVANDVFPTIYRMDRIKDYKILEEHFFVPYANRFEEGEFRKRVQFMYGGKCRRVRFEYTGYSVEAILDRLPTAQIMSEEDGKFLISAEVFGDGIDMWLRSQGEFVRVIE